MESENNEDLMALLDDALQDFETQSSCTKKVSNPSNKGNDLHKRSITSKNDIVSSTICADSEHSAESTKSHFCSGLKSEDIGQSSQQQLPGTSSPIPTEKELEDMFNDLMKSTSLGQNPDEMANTDLNQVLPMMENMMQSLLSAEILHPPLKELCNKYPEWLAENRQSLKPKDYDNYNKQYAVAKELCHEFEKYQQVKESKTKVTDDVQNVHFEKVFELMQKMQSFGNPPSEIVGQFGAIPNGGGANGNMQQEEERFKSFLAQNGLDAERGVQFDAYGKPIFPEGFSGNVDQCLIS